MFMHRVGYASLVLCLFVGGFLLSGQAEAQDLVLQAQIDAIDGPVPPLQFGVRAGALPGLDDFDLPAPPVSPGGEFAAYLAMLEPPAGFPNAWIHDFRALERFRQARFEIWEMTWENLLWSDFVIVSLSALSEPDFPYQVLLHGPDGFSLEMSVPGIAVVPVQYANMDLIWEVILDDPVTTRNQSLGGVKTLYR
jgi:hypothetical protein